MNRSGLPGISAFTLKVVAILGMTACHAGVLAEDLMPWPLLCLCEALGGVTFPIMAYLLAEGYRHTSNCRQYACRLAAFAVIAQVPYGLFFEPLTYSLGEGETLCLPFTGNVLFTLLLGLGLLAGYDRMRNRTLYWALAAVGIASSAVLDWGILGPVMVLLSHLLEEGWRRRAVPGILAAAALGLPALQGLLLGDASLLPEALYALAGVPVAAVLLLCYDGTRGRPLKWFFYLYYPLHIAIIGVAVSLLS